MNENLKFENQVEQNPKQAISKFRKYSQASTQTPKVETPYNLTSNPANQKQQEFNNTLNLSIIPKDKYVFFMSAFIQQKYASKRFKQIKNSSTYYDTVPETANKKLNIKNQLEDYFKPDKQIYSSEQDNQFSRLSELNQNDNFQQFDQICSKFSNIKKSFRQSQKVNSNQIIDLIDTAQQKQLLTEQNEVLHQSISENKHQLLSVISVCNGPQEKKEIKEPVKKAKCQLKIKKILTKTRNDSVVHKPSREMSYLVKEIRKKKDLSTIQGNISTIISNNRYGSCEINDQLLLLQDNQTVLPKVNPVHFQIRSNSIESHFKFQKFRHKNLKRESFLEKLIQMKKEFRTQACNSNLEYVNEEKAFNQLVKIESIESLKGKISKIKKDNQKLDIQDQNDIFRDQIEQTEESLQKLEILQSSHSSNQNSDPVSVNQKVKALLENTELTQRDLMSQEQKNKKIFDNLSNIYNQIKKNSASYGYAKSPDFKLQEELLQRDQVDQWLKTRGKSQRNTNMKQYRDSLLQRNSLNIVKIKNESLNLQKNDQNKEQNKQDLLSQDKQNNEIIRFCTYLFMTWLEDYKGYAEFQMDLNLTYHLQSANEGVLQNIKDKCLPIDYFMERMLQIGVCSSMKSLRDIIEQMLMFDNAGFTLKNHCEVPQNTDNQQKFEPMNYRSREARLFIKQNLNSSILQATDRISLNQFLSIFNIEGVECARKIDQVISILKKEIQLESQTQTQNETQRQKQAFGQEFNDNEQMKQKFMKGLRNTVSPVQRKISGIASMAFGKQSQFKFTARSISIPKVANINNKNDITEQIHLSNLLFKNKQANSSNQKLGIVEANDEDFYNEIMKEFENIKNIVEFIQESKIASKEKAFQNLDEEYEILKNNGSLINPLVILDSIKDQNQSGLQMKKNNFIKLIQLANPKQLDCSNSIQHFLTELLLNKRKNSFEKYSRISRCQKQSCCDQEKDEIFAKKFIKKYNIQQNALKLLKDKYKQCLFQAESQVHSNESQIQFKKIEDSIDIIRKQIILFEVCKDLIQIQQILAGLLTYDSVYSISQKDDNYQLLQKYDHFHEQESQHDKYKSSVKLKRTEHKQLTILDSNRKYKTKQLSKAQMMYKLSVKDQYRRTVNEQQALGRRQYYRKQFQEFIMVKIKQKYSSQLNLFYTGNENLVGKSLFNGASMQMNKDPQNYGIQSRTILIKIASLMVKNKIYLGSQNYKDIWRTDQQKAREQKNPSIFGWLVELSQHEEIRHELRVLVNLVLDQIKDRENSITFPNENIESIIACGRRMWFKHIDPERRMTASKVQIENFFLGNKIVKDYKEIQRFVAGTLNGFQLHPCQEFQKTLFMRIVYKASLREAIKNIITFCQFGLDYGMEKLNNGFNQNQIVPFSLQIQKLQRLVLFNGIKTKNSKSIQIQNKREFAERSKACQTIVENLQFLKKSSKILTMDKCKIMLQQSNDKFQEYKSNLTKLNNIQTDLEMSKEWQAHLKFSDHHPGQSQVKSHDVNEKLRVLEEKETKKKILKLLIGDYKQQPNTINSVVPNSRIKKSPLDLPQVQQALNINFHFESVEFDNIIKTNQKFDLQEAAFQGFGDLSNENKLNLKKKTIALKLKGDMDKNKYERNFQKQNDGKNTIQNLFVSQKSSIQTLMRNAINKKIDAKLKRLLELGEDKDQIKSRISLIDRQNFRSAATRELLKKAV